MCNDDLNNGFGISFQCDNVNIPQMKSKCSSESLLCDGIVTKTMNINFQTSDDEIYCNGYVYGVICDTGSDTRNRIPSRYITCNSLLCLDGTDKSSCSNITHYCESYALNEIVPIFNFSRCGPIGSIKHWDNKSGFSKNHLCVGYKEQTNCSDPLRAGLICEIDGYKSTVAKQVICNPNLINRTPLCDDKIDIRCMEITLSCTIHKHQFCDGVSDCIDKTDESNCRDISNKTCQRKYIKHGKLKEVGIPFKWIRDGEFDCVNGDDELGEWPTCGFGDTKRFSKMDINFTCSEVFLCNPGHIEFSDLCDGEDSCGNENNVCTKSRTLFQLFESPVIVGKVISMLHCLNGLETLDKAVSGKCSIVKFQISYNNILGRTKFLTISLPQKLNWTVNCGHIYGAAYVYLSCLNRCFNSSCILKDPLRFDSCKGQNKDRVLSLAKDDNLTFLIRNREDGSYHNDNIFPCRNGGCVSYDKVCNLVDDCDDASDEVNCRNHFQCSETKKFIPLTKVCDNTVDCLDMSDECNRLCNKEMIESFIVKILGWSIGILAVIFNLLTIPVAITSIKCSKTYESLSNNVFLCLISIGDLLLGIFIFAISAYDVFYGSSYCKSRMEWLTSMMCSMAGVLSSFGILISVLSMSFLSLFRVSNIAREISISSPITNKGIFKISLIGIMVMIVALLVSVIPLIKNLEDYFVNGLYHGPDNTLFLGAPDKGDHKDILEAYYGRLRTKSLSWRLIRQLLSGMFSNDYSGIHYKKIQFYANDGICVFKYLVRKQDPQYVFVWISHSIQILSFFTISMAYILIARKSSLYAPKLADKKANKSIGKRSRKVQRKVAIIILSDFVSWIPFIFVCVLHSTDVLDATAWYSIFSLILNPLNAVINPLILNPSIIDKMTHATVYFRYKINLVITPIINLQNIFKRDITASSSVDVIGEGRIVQNVLINGIHGFRENCITVCEDESSIEDMQKVV